MTVNSKTNAIENPVGLGQIVNAISFTENSTFSAEIGRVLQKENLKFKGFIARSREVTQRAVEKYPIAFLLCDVGDPQSAGKSLSPFFPLLGVRTPPLVIRLNQEPNHEQYEAFRLQGVAHIVVGKVDPVFDAPVLLGLAKSASWLSVEAESVPLSEILQMMDRLGGPAMVSLVRSDETNFSSIAWENSNASHWQGRIYIENGEVVWAETPDKTEIPALSEMLELQKGKILVHRNYLKPMHAEPYGSIESMLLKALVHLDQKAQGSSGPETIPPNSGLDVPLVNSASSFSDPDEDTQKLGEEVTAEEPASDNHFSISSEHGGPDMSKLESLLALDRSLTGVASADSDGNVLQAAGAVDGETLCAVAAMGGETIEEVGGLLGLGYPKGWALGQDLQALYVFSQSNSFVAATGKSVKTPETVLKKLQDNAAR